MTDKEWEERQKTRTLEMEAVSKALAVLSGDDAHDLFTRTFNPSFIQTNEVSAVRERAADVLAAAAQKLNKPQLSTLASQVPEIKPSFFLSIRSLKTDKSRIWNHLSLHSPVCHSLCTRHSPPPFPQSPRVIRVLHEQIAFLFVFFFGIYRSFSY